MKTKLALGWLLLFGPFVFSQPDPAVLYTVAVENPVHHYFRIQIDLPVEPSDFVDLQMPAWAPGRYAILDFARNVRDFEARAGQAPLPFEKIDKQTWRVRTAGIGRVTVTYRVYANSLSGEYSQLNDRHGFLVGAGLYLYAVNRKDRPVSLRIVNRPGWSILSAAGEPGQTEFLFPNYDLMIDSPVQIGRFPPERFLAGGVEYRISVLNNGDRTRIPVFVQNMQKIVSAVSSLLPPPDFDRYTFFFHFLPQSRHSAGMEHLSACQVTRRHDLSDWNENMDWTYWTAAHEFIHAWNGKRLRPAGFGPFDYTKEVYSPLLWFTEGGTSYLTDLALRRSGLWSRDHFFLRLAQSIQTYRSTPGIYERSAEQASFDTWFWDNDVYAESDTNNTYINYYTKGDLLGYCMDFEIRRLTRNRHSFEDFFRLLYDRVYQNAENESEYLQGRGFTTEDLMQALEDLTQSPWDEFYQNLIAEPGDIPLESYFAEAGLELVEKNPAAAAPYTGLHLSASPGGSPKIDWIEEQSPAYKANLDRQDVLIALDGQKVTPGDFKDVLLRGIGDGEVKVSFLRDVRLLETTMKVTNDWKDKEYAIRLKENIPNSVRRIRNDWLGLPETSSTGRRHARP